MPSKDIRRLMPMGNSLVITLPKVWLNFWQLKKGEKLEIIYDGVLIIIPPNHPKKKEIRKKIKEALL